MSENQSTLEAYRLVHEGALALAEVEANGMAINVPYLFKVDGEIEKSIKDIKQELRGTPLFEQWRKRYGQKATLTSPQQLAGVFYDVLGYTPTTLTAKAGKPKADEDALTGLKFKEKSHKRFVKRYYEMKRLDKIKGTYLAGIKKELVGELIHPMYHLHTASTTRSSSSDPNGQNFIKEELFRKCFIPRRPGNHIVEFDYGGHEFKIASAVWSDPEMIRYASDPKADVHRDMAAKLFLMTNEQVKAVKGLRQAVKSYFVFATLYGSWWLKTALNLWNNCKGLKFEDGKTVRQHLREKGIRELGEGDQHVDHPEGTFKRHVKEFEAEFFRQFSVFARAKDEWYNGYRKNLGFRLKTGFWISRQGEKDAKGGSGEAGSEGKGTGGLCTKNFCLNAPVQGPAFHCVLWSLIRLQKLLKKRGMKAVVIGQIHDSILADVPGDELQEFLTLVRRVMTRDIRKAWDWIVVPLEAECSVAPMGKSWAEKALWVEREGVWGPAERKAT